jgi:hypothetical protein
VIPCPEPWEALEEQLASLPDEAWTSLMRTLGRSAVKVPADGPIQTGDPVIDQWERELWSEAQAEAQAKGTGGGGQR